MPRRQDKVMDSPSRAEARPPGRTGGSASSSEGPTGTGPRKLLARAAACLAGAALALALAASVEGMIAAWAAGLLRTGPPHVKRFAARKLASLGRPGTEALFELARDRTVVPVEGSPPLPERLIPRNTVGDFALAALRRMREREEGPLQLVLSEWCVDSGVSYEEAMEDWRAEELARAKAWWESVKKATP